MNAVHEAELLLLSYCPFKHEFGTTDLSGLPLRIRFLNSLIEEIKDLLVLPPKEFITRVGGSKSIALFFESFVSQHAESRLSILLLEMTLEQTSSLVEDLLRSEEQLASVIFRLGCRFVNVGEAPNAEYIATLRKQGIFRLPQLLDFASVFGRQSAFPDVAKAAIDYLPDILRDLRACVRLVVDQIQNSTEPSLVSKPRNSSSNKFMVDLAAKVSWFQDLFLGLCALGKAHTLLTKAFQNSDFFLTLTKVYDDCLLTILDDLENNKGPFLTRPAEILQQRVHNLKREMLSLASAIIEEGFRNRLDSTLGSDVDDSVTMLMASFQDSETRTVHEGKLERHGCFIQDFEDVFNLRTRLVSLKDDRSSAVDEALVDYLLLSITSLDRPKSNKSRGQRGGQRRQRRPEMSSTDLNSRVSIEHVELNRPEEIENDVASRIAQVRDLLPDVGEGFVEACLAKLGTPDAVINHILEGSLPEPLLSMDHGMARATWQTLKNEIILTGRFSKSDLRCRFLTMVKVMNQLLLHTRCLVTVAMYLTMTSSMSFVGMILTCRASVWQIGMASRFGSRRTFFQTRLVRRRGKKRTGMQYLINRN